MKFLFALLFIAGFCFSQPSKQETDSLLQKEIPRLRATAEIEKSLILCKKIIKYYELLNDKKGKCEAYLEAANIAMNMYKLNESLEYLELAEYDNENLKDPVIEARIYGEYARNYDYLGYQSLALENYNKAISILKTVKNQEKRLEYMYSVKGYLNEKEKRYKEFYEDAQKAHHYHPTPYTSIRLAKYFIVYEKKLDSAKYYLDLGEKLYEPQKFPIFQKGLLIRMNGRYHFAKKEYEKAISYYQKSLPIFESLNNLINIKEDYKLLYKAYKALGDGENEKKYLEKYSEISDSIGNIKKINLEIPLKKVINENKILEEKSKKNTYLLFIILLLFLLLVVLLLQKKYTQKSKEKEIIIQEKEEENEELKQKVNESFEEVVQLAKTNSPEFLTRFKEVYPEYYQKLISIEPKLLETELKLCTMIYLGFSSKDIADYTFVTLKAAQHRKFRLRKKLGIPSNVEISQWLDENY